MPDLPPSTRPHGNHFLRRIRLATTLLLVLIGPSSSSRVPPTELHHNAFQTDCLAGCPLDQCRVCLFDPRGFCPEMRKETRAESMAHTQHKEKKRLHQR